MTLPDHFVQPTQFAPVSIFAYQRPSHLKTLLNSLELNREFAFCPVYVWIDGINRNTELNARIAVIELIESRRRPNWTVVVSATNQGLANSIIHGVTTLCHKYGRVIVLEDDLEVSPYFLKFMNEALSKYEFDPSVFHISGYLYPIPTVGLPEVFFFRNASSWGWGTWSRAWDQFCSDSEFLITELNKNKSLINRFNIDGAEKIFEMLIRQKNGDIDSWSIRWDATLIIQNGLSLYPGSIGTLVQNNGFDGSGVHSGSKNIFRSNFGSGIVSRWPSQIGEDQVALARLKSFFRSNSPSLVIKIWRKLSKMVRQFSVRICRLG